MNDSDRTDVFRGLAHPLRRQIVKALRSKDLAVTEIAEQFDVSQPALSRHLAVLRETGLVTQRAVGRQRRYRLRKPAMRSVKKWVAQFR